MRFWSVVSIWVVGCLMQGNIALAQGFSIPEIQHPRNINARKDIDFQKPSTSNVQKDFLSLAREFKRRDSTYYVPWMLEGLYYRDHAADYLGFLQGSQALRKAYDLITKDYAKYLKTRTNDIFVYFPLYDLHGDFAQITSALTECYAYIDRADSAFNIAVDFGKYNLQNEGVFSSFDTKSWIVHRNRFYTPQKYAFLKPTIEENERLAHAFLDSSMVKIFVDKKLNANFLNPGYEAYLKYGVYHYKTILFGYSLEIDSALNYYELMKATPYFSNNNFGNLQMVRGLFRQSQQHYIESEKDAGSEKQLQENKYYGAILQLFNNEVDTSIHQMLGVLQKSGSTPGFGWYNLALTRSLNYGGNTQEVQKYWTKAAEFKELHIGTTLGESHYNFTVALTKYHSFRNELQWIKFKDKGWWYKPKKLWKVARTWLSSVVQKYKIVLLLKNNPEREQVIYKLFATESTVTWDEILMAMRGMSNNYFKKHFDDLAENDPRPLIKVYFQFAKAQILYDQGKYDEAQILVDDLKDYIIGDDYEQLFRARILLLDNLLLDEQGGQSAAIQQNLLEIYQIYPQLLPFQPHQLQVQWNNATLDKAVKNALTDYKIDWVAINDDSSAPQLVLASEDAAYWNFSVVANGQSSTISCKKINDAAEVANQIVEAVFHIAQIPE